MIWEQFWALCVYKVYLHKTLSFCGAVTRRTTFCRFLLGFKVLHIWVHAVVVGALGYMFGSSGPGRTMHK